MIARAGGDEPGTNMVWTAEGIKNLRTRRGESVSAFAGSLGVMEWRVRELESGTVQPSAAEVTTLDNLDRFAQSDMMYRHRKAREWEQYLRDWQRSPVKSVVFPGGGGAVIDVGTPAVTTSSYTGPSYTRAVVDDFINSGLANLNKANYDQAIADFSQAIALNPNSAVAHYDRGFAYLNRADYDHAIADFSQAIAVNPNNALAHSARGLAYRAKGDYDQAIADFSQAIALNPNSSVAHSARGLAYRAKGDYDQAIADFNRATEIDPKMPWPTSS